jgi:transcription termination/antitermination protein NusG
MHSVRRSKKTMSDEEGSSVADDAVSNRSDDTALDESHAVPANGQNISRDVPAEEGGAGEASERAIEKEPVVREAASEVTEEIAKAQVAAGTAEESEIESGEIESDAEAAAEAEQESAAAIARRRPVEETPEEPEEIRMDWYILKVQSNRERSIAEALERKMKIEGYDRFFDQVIVPTEKVTEFKGGKKKIVERKLYPGYIVVHMHINDDTWFAVRETSGVGDFTGAGGKPTPMLPQEVSRIIQTEEEETSEAPKLDIKFSSGDKVKVKEGNFENFEGEVNTIDEASGRVTVMINIFGRSTPVELEYWQIEAV